MHWLHKNKKNNALGAVLLYTSTALVVPLNFPRKVVHSYTYTVYSCVQIRYCNFTGCTQSAVNAAIIHQPSLHSEQPEQHSEQPEQHSEQPEQHSGKH